MTRTNPQLQYEGCERISEFKHSGCAVLCLFAPGLYLLLGLAGAIAGGLWRWCIRPDFSDHWRALLAALLASAWIYTLPYLGLRCFVWKA